MTRDEFISAYMAGSPMCRDADRTAQGFEVKGMTSGGRWLALPCECDYDECHGWAMMPAELTAVLLHCDGHLPDGLGPLVFNARCAGCGATWAMTYNRDLIGKLIHRAPPCRCPDCDTADIFALIVDSYEQAARKDAAS